MVKRSFSEDENLSTVEVEAGAKTSRKDRGALGGKNLNLTWRKVKPHYN